MQYLKIFATAIFAAIPIVAAADGVISVPASQFSGNGLAHNSSGTSVFLRTTVFAPVNLPDSATVTSFACGGMAPFQKEIIFTLRRNEPQQANVDMATLRTGLDERAFVNLNTTNIVSGLVNNRRFNYFIVADSSKPGGNQPGNRTICNQNNASPQKPNTECVMTYCRIRYSGP